MIMVMFNLMIKKKVNWKYYYREQWCSYTYTWLNNKKSPYNKNNVATIKINKILAKFLLLGLVE